MTAGRLRAALLVLPLALGLTACATTVTGTGRPAAGGGFGTTDSPTTGGNGPTSSAPSPGEIDSSGDPHEVWHAAIDASIPAAGSSVLVIGVVSGAGVGGAKVKAVYGTGDDGNPVANVGIVVDSGALEIVATGGEAWAKATAAVYEEYGYDDAGSEEAAGRYVVVSDDDSGLDVYADLATVFDLVGPDDDADASLEDDTYDGKDVVAVIDEEYDVRTYVDPETGHIIASVFDDETVTFDYSDTAITADAPSPSDVVEVDGF